MSRQTWAAGLFARCGVCPDLCQAKPQPSTSMKPNRDSCNFNNKWKKGRILQAPAPECDPSFHAEPAGPRLRAQALQLCCVFAASAQRPRQPTQALDPGRMSPENGQAQKTGVETNTMDRRGGAVQSGRVDQQNAISEQTHMGNDRWHSAFPCCPLTSDQGVFRHPFAGKARKRETEG